MKPNTSTMRTWLRRALVPLFVVALAYVAYSVATQFNEVLSAIARMPAQACVIALIAAIGCVAARATYRLALYDLAGYGAALLPRALALQSFAWGQLLRYLPGKVSGPAAEAVMLEPYLPWTALLRVTIFETLAMMFLSLFWILASVLFVLGFHWIAIACLGVGLLATWYVHYRGPWLRQVAPLGRSASRAVSFSAVGMLVAEWILFYLIWIAVAGPAWFVSATAYAVASWTAAAVLVAPAGLGVRELVFSELTPHFSTFDKVDLLGQAIVLRVLLTAADILFPIGLLALNRGLINDRS